MTVLLFGKNGQLGSEINKRFGFEKILSVGRDDLDCQCFNAVEAFLKRVSPDIVINCVAYTNVDAAESDIDAAFQLNSYFPELLAKYAYKNSAVLIHYSSDYVFDGLRTDPYTEACKVNPIGIYGQSKMAGDVSVEKTGAQHIIIRTSWVYSNHGSNFPNTILRMALDGKAIRVVDDQRGSPTHTRLLADATNRFIEVLTGNSFDHFKHTGTFNVSSKGNVTWFEFAEYFLELLKKKYKNSLAQYKIMPVSSDEYVTAAKRPSYSVLDCSKFELAFDYTMPKWQMDLADFVDKKDEDYS